MGGDCLPYITLYIVYVLYMYNVWKDDKLGGDRLPYMYIVRSPPWKSRHIYEYKAIVNPSHGFEIQWAKGEGI